ncbi:MAG: class I SAM-dependent methyltransferase [Synergistaceae bacterium]|jgi:O-methyltransferase|nr:class I SAM-dependent methyltransferase [Synergistaceae bacterium]
MDKIVIWGAGQCGKWLRKLLEGSGFHAIAFADSDPGREGEEFEGLPVRSPKDLAVIEWGTLFVAIKGKERVAEVLRQLSELGLSERRIETLPSFLVNFDARYTELELSARLAREWEIAGAVAELGVYRGNFAVKINEAFPDRPLYLFDTFEGFSERDIAEERRGGFSSARAGEFEDTDVETVRSRLPFPEKTVFRKGFFPESASGLLDEEFCFVSLDADLYAPVYEGLKYFYPRLSVGGCIVLHDYDSLRFRGVGEAARRYCSERGLFIQPLWDMHGSAVLRKPRDALFSSSGS